MAIEQKRKVINDVTYLVTQMNGVKALQTQTKLLTLIGPNLGELSKTLSDGVSMEDMGHLLPILSSMLSGVDSDTLSTFILSLFDSGVFTETMVEGRAVPRVVNFDDHFIGKIAEMWQVVAFILEANFSQGN